MRIKDIVVGEEYAVGPNDGDAERARVVKKGVYGRVFHGGYVHSAQSERPDYVDVIMMWGGTYTSQRTVPCRHVRRLWTEHVPLHEAEQERRRKISETQRLKRAMQRHSEQLLAALEPFAHFANQWEAQPLGRYDDEIYSIHTGTEWEASIRLSDLQKARDVLTMIRDEASRA